MSDESRARLERLEHRVEVLESSLRDLGARADHERHQPDSPPAATVWSAPQPRAAWPPPAAVAPHPASRPGFALEGEVALKWGGVGLVVLAVGFAVSTAIRRGWIGPELQLVGAVAISLGLVGVGLRLRTDRPAWTHALCVGGVLALFTTFASDLFLDQANDVAAFTATVVIGLGGALLAHRVPSEWVGAATVAGSLAAWFVIADGEPPVGATSAWVVVIVACTVGLSIAHRWHALRLLAHFAGMYALLWTASEADGSGSAVYVLVATALLAASLVRVPSIGDLRSPWQQVELQLVVLAAPWLLGVLDLSLAPDGDRAIGATAIAVAAGALAVAFASRHWIRPAHFVSQLVGSSIALSIGLTLLLSATVAFAALAVQGAGLVVLNRTLRGSVPVLINAAIVIVVAAGFAVAAMLDAWTDDASVGDDLAHLTIVAAIAVAAWQTQDRLVRRLGALAVLVLTLIWTGSVLVHLPQGQALVSVSWAVIGTAVLVVGAMRKMPDVGVVGLAVLGLTLGKLLTVDLQEVDTLWRAGLFLLVGLVFLRLGFLLPRLTSSDDDHDDRDG